MAPGPVTGDLPSTEPSGLPHQITIGVVCSIGVGPNRGGRSRNEDNYLVGRGGEIRFRGDDGETVRKVPEGEGTLLVIADGMGGHDDGALASSAAVQAFARFYEQGRPDAPELTLHRFVLSAHRRIRTTLSQRGPVSMGTTLTAGWILEDRLFWIHVGDSRLYHLRGTTLTCLTRDHTRGEFARRDGRRPPKDPDLLAQNFLYGSRGLGEDAAIRIDPGRDTGSMRLAVGDYILLCTDGISRFVDEFRIAYAMHDVPSPAACAEVLAERAMALGSNDNITAIIARVDALPPPSQPEEEPPAPPADSPDDTLVPE